jgi:hypothetical protein
MVSPELNARSRIKYGVPGTLAELDVDQTVLQVPLDAVGDALVGSALPLALLARGVAKSDVPRLVSLA